MELIKFNNDIYPKFQSSGNASRFILPFATEVCKGYGYDIGYCKEEWKMEKATGIDIEDKTNDFDANKLPDSKVDYIFSSHCLEHVDCWFVTLEYWISKIKSNGILFLYLPDFSQKYWRPWNNRKHLHCLTPDIIKNFLIDKQMNNIYCSGIDLNNSFSIMCSIP
jgi:hypothetical protein